MRFVLGKFIMNKKKTLSVLSLIGYAVLIFYVSSLTGEQTEPSDWIFDVDRTILHFVEFAVLGGLSFYTLGQFSNRILLPIGFSMLYALLDEVHQFFVPTRFFDVFDVIVNMIGVFVGAILLFLYRS